MQANFIESNPLPVKAALAMMGKIAGGLSASLAAHAARYAIETAASADRTGSITKPAGVRSGHGRISMCMRAGLPGRIRRSCTARSADSAILAKGARLDMTRTTRVGTVRLPRSPKRAT